MPKFEIQPGLYKKLKKLYKKDRKSYEKIMNKIEDIAESDNVNHYKNLRHDMKDSKRVQLGHFVLIFSYDRSKDVISFEDYDHHDNIYKR